MCPHACGDSAAKRLLSGVSNGRSFFSPFFSSPESLVARRHAQVRDRSESTRPVSVCVVTHASARVGPWRKGGRSGRARAAPSPPPPHLCFQRPLSRLSPPRSAHTWRRIGCHHTASLAACVCARPLRHTPPHTTQACRASRPARARSGTTRLGPKRFTFGERERVGWCWRGKLSSPERDKTQPDDPSHVPSTPHSGPPPSSGASPWPTSPTSPAPAETISTPQQCAVTATGIIWSRFSTQITPVNYNLLSVNAAMACTGMYQLARKFWVHPVSASPTPTAVGVKPGPASQV